MDITKALKDIEEKNLPLQKGVIFGAIKRQVELRNNQILYYPINKKRLVKKHP